MPDFTRKIMKNCADELQAGEEFLLADNSARIFECGRMTRPQDIVDAFDKMKGTRKA